MALNFPDSPTLNQVYTDTTSGFSYQWDGVVWQSYAPASSSQIKIIDDISGSFNGSTQTFALAVSGVPIFPANAQQLRVVLGGVVQEPVTDYTVSGSDITFTTPPSGGLDCSIISLGPAVPVYTLEDGVVTPANLSTGGPSWNTAGDLNVSGIVTATSFVKSGGTSSQFLKADGSVDSNTYLTTETQTLDDVTSLGNSTSNGISVGVLTATSIKRSGGTSSQFLKADGSVDSNTYLTTETQTLDDVTSLGNITTNGISVGVLTATGGFNIGIQSEGTDVTTGVITAINFVGTGNSISYNPATKTVDVSVSSGEGSGVSTTGITTGYIWSNPNSIDADISLNSPNRNYGMFGPITISPGVTVTVGVGNTFTVI